MTKRDVSFHCRKVSSWAGSLSESTPFYLIMLAHDIRGGCWWYGNRGWTFPATQVVAMGQMAAEWHSWQSAIWHGSEYEVKGWNLNSSMKKNGIHWHSLTLSEHFWRSDSESEHCEALGGTFHQWRQWFSQIFMSTACRHLFTSGKNVQPMVVPM